MRGHGPSVFQRAAGFKVCPDAGGAKGMAADRDVHANECGPPLDHAPDIDRADRLFGQGAGAAGGRTEEGGFATITDAGRVYEIGRAS